jgi:hypothetical protein
MKKLVWVDKLAFIHFTDLPLNDETISDFKHLAAIILKVINLQWVKACLQGNFAHSQTAGMAAVVINDEGLTDK